MEIIHDLQYFINLPQYIPHMSNFCFYINSNTKSLFGKHNGTTNCPRGVAITKINTLHTFWTNLLQVHQKFITICLSSQICLIVLKLFKYTFIKLFQRVRFTISKALYILFSRNFEGPLKYRPNTVYQCYHLGVLRTFFHRVTLVPSAFEALWRPNFLTRYVCWSRNKIICLWAQQWTRLLG